MSCGLDVIWIRAPRNALVSGDVTLQSGQSIAATILFSNVVCLSLCIDGIDLDGSREDAGISRKAERSIEAIAAMKESRIERYTERDLASHEDVGKFESGSETFDKRRESSWRNRPVIDLRRKYRHV